MPYTQTQNKATQRYIKKAYDSLYIRTKKGKKAEYMEAAEKKGMSFNAYVLDLIEKDIERGQKYEK